MPFSVVMNVCYFQQCCLHVWLKENPSITILHGSGARYSYPLCLLRVHTSVAAVATVEAMTQLLTQNAEFFRTMQQQQHQQVQEMLNFLQTMKADSGGGSDRRGEGLRERRFRELGNYSGRKEEWKEFGLSQGDRAGIMQGHEVGGGRGE